MTKLQSLQRLHRLSSGRSMIEMLGVLAIIGVLSVGGIAGYSKAMEKFKINKTAEQISQIAINIQTLYAQQTTYDGLNNTSAISMGVIPDDLGTNAGNGRLTNLFNGNVEISSGYYNSKYFGIVYKGISKNACIQLATLDWGSSGSSGLYGIEAGTYGTDVTTHIDATTSICGQNSTPAGLIACSHKGSNTIGIPVPVSTASQFCTCTSNTCFISVVFE